MVGGSGDRDAQEVIDAAAIVPEGLWRGAPEHDSVAMASGDTAHVVANQKVLSPVKRLLGNRSDNVGVQRQR